MRKKLLPPIHPGEILREEFMRPLNLSANALAQRLGVTTARVNEIANERRGITADTALRLARCFSTTPEFWMNLTFPVARYGVGLSFREVFGIEFCDTPQLAAGSFILQQRYELEAARRAVGTVVALDLAG
ncbi:MAG TPA: HigA family addiction module antitoxin [Nitrospira sp.]|nr:HigA family addiction module antitoxin [Nitrospira sp.]